MGITTTDFCCGRTQHDVCRECGRDFNAPFKKGAPVMRIETRFPPEIRWFLWGAVCGVIVGAGLGLLTFAISAWAFAGGLR